MFRDGSWVGIFVLDIVYLWWVHQKYPFLPIRFYLISKHCIIAININLCVSTIMLRFACSHPEFLEHVRYFL